MTRTCYVRERAATNSRCFDPVRGEWKLSAYLPEIFVFSPLFYHTKFQYRQTDGQPNARPAPPMLNAPLNRAMLLLLLLLRRSTTFPPTVPFIYLET